MRKQEPISSRVVTDFIFKGRLFFTKSYRTESNYGEKKWADWQKI